jgi:ABC-2 type transport system permease protein
MKRLVAIIQREVITVMRDKRSLFLVIFLPMMLMILYGYGVTFDIKHIPLGVFDQSTTQKSRELINKFISSGYFKMVDNVDSYGQLEALLINDEITLGMVIPPYFATELISDRGAVVQILVNGSDANTANVAMGYQAAVFSEFSLENADFPPDVKIPSVVDKTRIWFNSDLKSSNFIVPGIIVIVMMLLGAILTSNAIVKEKETGTIEQIMASPIKPWEYVFGKITPYIMISLFDVFLVVAAGYLIFEIPSRGSLWCLAFFSFLFLANALGIGLFVSAVSKSVVTSQLMAFMISLLPSILLSGFIFPISSMPHVIQAITYVVPARYFLTILRGIFLKGVGFDVLWPQGLFLLANSLVFLGLAAKNFKKNLD